MYISCKPTALLSIDPLRTAFLSLVRLQLGFRGIYRDLSMAKKTDIWMPIYIADYLADTMHLSTAEHGAYLLIIMAYWRNRQPIKKSHLKSITRMDEKLFETSAFTLSEFFTIEQIDGEEVWRHERIDAELAKAMNNKEIKSINGKLGGRPKKLNESKTKANGKLNIKLNESPSPSPSLSKDKERGEGDKSPFVLNEKIPKAVWQDWHDYRNSQKGWTAKAKTLSANSLLALIEKGYDAQTIVNKSIENGWKGLFEPKPDKFAKPEVRPTFTKVEKTPEQIALEKAEAQKAHAKYMEQFGVAV